MDFLHDLLLRPFMDMAGQPDFFLQVIWEGFVAGILYALMENDLKRLLAFSSIEHAGIVVLGLGAALLLESAGQREWAAIAFAGALLQVLNHAAFKGALFLGAGVAMFFRFVGAHQSEWDMIVKAGTSNDRAADKIRNFQAEAVARSVRQTLATDHAGLGEAQLDELALAIAFAINGATEGLARWWREHRDWTPDDLGALIASIFFRDAAT